MRTYVAKGVEAEALKVGAQWFVIDATDQVLGRLATRAARILIGKDKPAFTPYLDSGDHVVVINAEKIRMTGNKLDQKVYYSHSGYPGGLKAVPAKRVREARPEWVVREAIVGMLPKNKLRARREKIARLSGCQRLGAAHRSEAASRRGLARERPSERKGSRPKKFPHVGVLSESGPRQLRAPRDRTQAFAGNHQRGVPEVWRSREPAARQFSSNGGT